MKIFWKQRIEELLNRQRARRLSEKNQRELLRLGPHLLRDIGIDVKGCPLEPNWNEPTDCDRLREMEWGTHQIFF